MIAGDTRVKLRFSGRFFQDQTGVVAAESKRIGNRDVDRRGLTFVLDMVQHRAFGIDLFEIDRRRH
jgi:hypothetical protein